MSEQSQKEQSTFELPTAQKSAPVNRALVATGDRGLAFSSMSEIIDFAKLLSQSQFVPKGLENPADVFAAVCMSMELGIAPVTGIQNMAVINHRVSIFGDLAKGLVDRSGLCEDYSQKYEGDPNSEDYKCVVTSKRVGRTPIVSEYSIRDAKKAGLWEAGAVWPKHAKRMLMWRARGYNLRDNFPDVLRGLPTAEEFDEFDSEGRFAAAKPAKRPEFKDQEPEATLPREAAAKELANLKAAVAQAQVPKAPGRPRKRAESVQESFLAPEPEPTPAEEGMPLETTLAMQVASRLGKDQKRIKKFWEVVKFWALASEDASGLEEISQENLANLLENWDSVESALK